jgi:hypothetical protein
MSDKESSQFVSMLNLNCPHCKASNMFVNPKTYSLSKLGTMKKTCEVCQTNFQPEPGFYFGAAYVSWGLTVGTWVAVLVALKVLNALGWIEFGFLTHPITFLLSGVFVSAVLFPYMYRLSRVMWAHMFIK